MFEPTNLAASRAAVDAAVVRRSVRTSGIGPTIFGVIALFGGMMPPMNLVLVSIGGALSASGLWNLTNPSPIGILLVSGCLMLVGVYNIFYTVTTGSGTPAWGVIGVWQLIWAYQGVQRYRRFANAHGEDVAEPDRREAEQALVALRKANVRKSPDVVECMMRGFPPARVRARLMPDVALCIIGDNLDVRLASRAEFDVQPVGEVKRGNARVKVAVAGRVIDAMMSAESLARFRAWKSGGAQILQRAA